jgi:hypothetical protein
MQKIFGRTSVVYAYLFVLIKVYMHQRYDKYTSHSMFARITWIICSFLEKLNMDGRQQCIDRIHLILSMAMGRFWTKLGYYCVMMRDLG